MWGAFGNSRSMRPAIAGTAASRRADAARRRRSTPRARAAAVRRPGARRQGVERRPRLRCRPAQPPRPGVHAGRQIRDAGVHQPRRPVDRVGGRRGASRPTRSSSSSTSPTTATRTSRSSTARPCRCSISSAAQRASPGDFQGSHHMAVDSKGNIYTGEVAPGRARSDSSSRGCRTRCRPTRSRPRNWRRRRLVGAGRPRPGAPQAAVRATYPPPGQARGGYPGWTSAMANPYRMTETGRSSATSSRARPSASSPTARAAPGCTTGPSRRFSTSTPAGRRSPLRRRHVRAGARLLPGPRRQLLGRRQRTVRRTGRPRGPRLPVVQVQPRRQGAADAGQGRRVEGRARHVHRPDGVRDRAQRRHHRGGRALAASDRRAAGRRSAGAAIKTDGKFVADYGKMGAGPGEFMGPHALAFDSQGRLFVADRSNNRVQIFDRDMQFVDEWRHFGRPSGITILKDDTLIVADSESSQFIGGPPEAPEGGGNAIRNPGWSKAFVSAARRTDRCTTTIPGTRPEGMAADESRQRLRRADRRLRHEPVGRLPAEVGEEVIRGGPLMNRNAWVAVTAGALLTLSRLARSRRVDSRRRSPPTSPPPTCRPSSSTRPAAAIGR